MKEVVLNLGRRQEEQEGRDRLKEQGVWLGIDSRSKVSKSVLQKQGQEEREWMELYEHQAGMEGLLCIG